MTSATTPAGQLRSALAADGARPFVTFYDDATGERAELSVATFDNWVAKTANLFQDELGAAGGERVAILLPVHWQTLAVFAACWSAGLVAVAGGDPAGADHVVAGPQTLAEARACSGERVALSLRPLGGRFVQRPEGFLDFAAHIGGQGDRFVPYAPVTPDTPALEIGGRIRAAGELADEATRTAAGLGLRTGTRLLSAEPLTSWNGLLAGLLLPLATDGSVVLCRNPDPARMPGRAGSERVTGIARTTLTGGLDVSSR